MPETSSQIRQAFLDFFGRHGHEIVASGPLVLPNDPTLLFANAGMVQFKDVFTGREARGYRRATTSQKCLRINGKHNDLENVGPSLRHHTFFEMLGNFSFGDYFKEEAILFAWEFLNKELALDPRRLMFTYFRGDPSGADGGLGKDAEAEALWKKVTGFADDRVVGLGRDENFWSMGETGPCGPCSEIHYFFGSDPEPALFGEELQAGRGWVEIWNLVFMQFERDGSGAYRSLPAPSIDTGMGLERLACVVQGKTANYDTDLLRGLADKTARIAGKKYQSSMSDDDISIRVIADHARASAFLLAEGVMPDRTGREYVLRRIMRRAIRHGHRLGISRPFLHEVALEVIELMGGHYGELVERRDHIASATEEEEKRFRQTIERGLTLLEESFAELESSGKKTLPGDRAFKLYDTFGFPLDLVEVISKERGYEVDNAGYDQALDEARRRSEFKGVSEAVEGVYREALASLPSLAGSASPAAKVAFTGYESAEDQSPITSVISEGKLVARVEAGAKAEIVVKSTPFYAETGGQVGDRGILETESGLLRVEDTVSPIDGLRVHRGVVERGEIRLGQVARLAIDVSRRDATRRNHSATHLLHWALREVVGSHAQQKGSLVAADQLRFDFTHPRALEPTEIERIEELVNERILRNVPVHTEVLPLAEARARGAVMIFEEKYGDTVRLLHIADSRELCGGTHVRATGDIGLFKITSEQGVAAGVRRISGTTGVQSLRYLRGIEQKLDRAARAGKSSAEALPEKIEKMRDNERRLQKQVDVLERKLALGNQTGGADTMLERVRSVAGVRVLGLRTEVTDRGALRELAEGLRDKLGDSIVLVASEHEAKAQLVLTVSKALTSRYRAGDLIRGLAGLVGGSGGGRPDLAQAGGTEVSRLDEAVEGIYAAVEAASSTV